MRLALPCSIMRSARLGWPQEVSQESPTKTRRQLGSYNYLFTAPVLSLGGRGMGVNLALSYNSRLWNKDNSQMTFNNAGQVTNVGLANGVSESFGTMPRGLR